MGRWGLWVAMAAAVAVTATAAVPVQAAGSSPASPRCPWVHSSAPVETRVAMVESRMTLADKLTLVHGVTTPAQYIGVQPGAPAYAGVIAGIPRLCIPELNLEDGPGGVGDGMTGVTQLPDPLAAAASWDPELVRAYGTAVGQEAWVKGVNVVLGPTVNIVRDPRWGRAFESFGEDPYLAGQLGVSDIEGIQSEGPMAQVKHLAAYNEEAFRDTAVNDAIVKPRVLHEIYLPAFAAAVGQAHVASVMCAYNETNHVRDCQSPYLLSQVLKGELGFSGFVTSDWFALDASAAAVDAGLDMEMPDACFLGTQLGSEVSSGVVAMGRLDDMVARILREMFAFGLFDWPRYGGPRAIATSPAHVALARAAAEEGTVLLRNKGGVLPIDAGRVRSIAVIGSDAGAQAQSVGGGSAQVVAPYVVTPYAAIARRAGKRTTVTYTDGTDLAQAAAAAGTADVAIVFVSNFYEEDHDHTTLGLAPPEDQLVSSVAAVNPHTIVVLNTGAAVVMPWLGQVAGVLEAWYPGQEDGNAVAAVLFGDANPSGKLPVTFPASQDQLPTSDPSRWPGDTGETQYSEGLLVGYRWYDAEHLAPAFPFGFGLSYTTFAFHDMRVASPSTDDGHETVAVAVTNTGTRTGADVVQLYVGDPPAAQEPLRQLEGFQRVSLAPGQTTQVTFELAAHALSFWDPALGRWKALAGRYTVAVGDSSRNLPLHAAFQLTRTVASGTKLAPAPPVPVSTAASDAATCWQDEAATLINGGLSLPGESTPANASELPLG